METADTATTKENTMKRTNPTPSAALAVLLRFRSAVLVLLAAALGILSLSACQGPAAAAGPDCQTPSALSVVIAPHANASPALPAEVACMARKAIENGHPISIVRDDGAPEAVLAPKVYKVSQATAQDDINGAKTSFARTAASVQATADGSNDLAALDKAARLTDGTPDAVIAVVSPGLSDQPPLDLTVPSLASADPKEVTAKLQSLKSVPALKGRTVRWYGVGDAHGTQQVLPSPQRQNYQDIWNAVLGAAGAHTEFLPGATGTTPAKANGHTVRPVPPVKQEAVDFPKAGTRTFDDASSLGFLPDSTDFRDPAAAAATGKQIADWLAANPGGTVAVAGTTATWGEPAYRAKLSLARAQAVSRVAQAAGADPSRLHPTGLGADFPGHVQDILPDGTLDPAKAEANRTVILTFTP
jgi:outer membrane protein OmpA-like peptidoglycan-associated protein